jgi:tRNA1(Val) A37 N6-methylase TrmN6
LITLYQPKDGYCFNSDSVFLYRFIAKFVPMKNRKNLEVLDVGCGVGVVGLLVTKEFGCKLWAIDKQDKNIFFTQTNARVNNLSCECIEDDFLTHRFDKKFDIIVSNPPFYHEHVIQSQNEHLNISRYNTHLPVDGFIEKAAKLLKPQGRFIFCYDAKQCDSLLVQLHKNKLNVEAMQFVHSKLENDAKLVFISARNNSRALTKILPPFVVFDKDSNYMDEAKLAFEKAGTHSIKCEG